MVDTKLRTNGVIPGSRYVLDILQKRRVVNLSSIAYHLANSTIKISWSPLTEVFQIYYLCG